MNPCLFVVVFCSGLLAASCGDSRSCDQLDCDDRNACTVDACNPDGAVCENEALPDATDCESDGVAGLCAAGACAALICDGVDCDDGNPCTVDACFPDLDQCANLPLPGLTVCEIDGSFGSCRQEVCDLELPPTGEAELRVELVGNEAQLVSYELICASDTTLSGNLSSVEGIWQAFLTLPAGECTARFSALDQMGETLCTGALDFQVAPRSLTPVGVTLNCGV